MKVLVIEDNPDILDIVDFILQDEGHEVIGCADGSSTDNLDAIQPSIIFLDELLPGTRGSMICKKLKADDRYKNIPVVLVSAIPSLAKIAEQSGADAWLEKPFDIDNLAKLINGLTAKR